MPDTLTCRSCGALNRRGPAACENCGASLRSAVPPWNIADALWRERVIWGGALLCLSIFLRMGNHSRWIAAISWALWFVGFMAMSPRAIKWWADRTYAWWFGVGAILMAVTAFVVGPDAPWTIGNTVFLVASFGTFITVSRFMMRRRGPASRTPEA